jgi:hypothetical protein
VEDDYVTCHICQDISAVGVDTSGRTGEGGGGSDEADPQLLFSFTTSYGDTTKFIGQKLTKFAFCKNNGVKKAPLTGERQIKPAQMQS